MSDCCCAASETVVRKRQPYYLLMLALLLVMMVGNACVPLYPMWQKSMGYSLAAIGIIFACYNFGVLISLFICGPLADRHGARVVLLPSMALTILASLVFAGAQNAHWLEAGRFINGLAAGGLVSAGTAEILKEGRRRGHINVALYASLPAILGFGVGPLFAGALAIFTPWPKTLVFELLLAVNFLVMVGLRATLPRAGMDCCGNVLRNATLAGEKKPWPVPGFPRGKILTLTAATALFSGPLGMAAFSLSLAPSILADVLHNSSPLLAGCISFLVYGSGMVGGFLFRRRSVKQQVWLGLICAILGAAGTLWAEYLTNIPLFAIGAVLIGFGQSLSQLAGVRLMHEFTPDNQLTSANSAFFLGGYATAGLSVVILGQASHAFGLVGGSEVFFGVTLVVLIAGWVGLRNKM